MTSRAVRFCIDTHALSETQRRLFAQHGGGSRQIYNWALVELEHKMRPAMTMTPCWSCCVIGDGANRRSQKRLPNAVSPLHNRESRSELASALVGRW